VKQHVLREGDVLQLGEHRLIYRDMRANFAKELANHEDDAESELEPATSLENN
jgi:hypothetical protein